MLSLCSVSIKKEMSSVIAVAWLTCFACTTVALADRPGDVRSPGTLTGGVDETDRATATDVDFTLDLAAARASLWNTGSYAYRPQDTQADAAAQGAEPTTDGATTDQAPTGFFDDFWTRDRILGDWGGARTDLANKGVTLNLRLAQFYQNIVDGGKNTSGEYGGLVDSVLTLNSEKLGLWDGFILTMHTQAQYGDSLAGDAGAFAFPNTAMLYPLPDYDGAAITALWGMQMLSPNIAVAGGKLNSVDIWSMIYPHTGGGLDGFMNVNMIAAALPWFRWVNLSELGGGVLVLADDGQIQGGLLVIDTANSTTTTGLSDPFDNGAGILALWRFFIEMDDKPGSILFAFGGATGDYAALDPSSWGFVPGVGPVEGTKEGTWSGAVYYDQVLWQDAGNDKRNLRLYTGWSISDGDPAFGKFGGVASLEAMGMLFGRDQDRAGVGLFYNELSRDFKRLTEIAGADVDDIWGGELYYNYEVTPWFHLTGDLQVVQGANSAADPAVILGLRGVLDF